MQLSEVQLFNGKGKHEAVCVGLHNKMTLYYCSGRCTISKVLLPCSPLTSGANVVEDGVVILCPQQRAGKDNGVEWHVVLGHELVQLHLLRVLPPLFPLICVASCDRQVAGGWGSRRCNVTRQPKLPAHTSVYSSQVQSLSAETQSLTQWGHRTTHKTLSQ